MRKPTCRVVGGGGGRERRARRERHRDLVRGGLTERFVHRAHERERGGERVVPPSRVAHLRAALRGGDEVQDRERVRPQVSPSPSLGPRERRGSPRNARAAERRAGAGPVAVDDAHELRRVRRVRGGDAQRRRARERVGRRRAGGAARDRRRAADERHVRGGKWRSRLLCCCRGRGRLVRGSDARGFCSLVRTSRALCARAYEIARLD
jgi:hypothetical protein